MFFGFKKLSHVQPTGAIVIMLHINLRDRHIHVMMALCFRNML
jgi:hypothetical protein